MITVPVALRGVRVAVTVRAVVAFAVVLAVAVVFFAVRVARAQQAAAPQSVPAGEGLVGRTSVPSAFTSASTAAGAAASGAPVSDSSLTSGASARGSPGRLVVIDVVGQVVHPGVVTVADGSRVVDVLTAAGGPLPGADVQRLNLARLVADGEQVFVPRPGETPPVLVGALPGSVSGPVGAGGGSRGDAPGGVAGAAAAVVDLNTATLAALDTLPGVGPVLAQRILDWRAQHGRFSSVDELGEVSGIGDKLLEQIRPKVRV
jgi:competence protein ComEA